MYKYKLLLVKIEPTIKTETLLEIDGNSLVELLSKLPLQVYQIGVTETMTLMQKVDDDIPF